jgi:tetratricopeptide (TPR) repeat protein
MFQTKHKALVLALSMALSGSLLMGCSGKDERQKKYLQRAQEYLAEGNYDKARIEAKNVLQINSTNAEAHYIFAEIAEYEKNWPSMYTELSAAIENDPKLIKALVKRGQLFIGANQIDRAHEEAEKVRAIDPNSADYFALLAAIAVRENKTDDVIENAQKAIQIEPGHIGAVAILGMFYANTDPAKAEQIVADGVRIHPDNDGLRMIQIRLLAEQNKTDQVIQGFKGLIKRSPEKIAYVSQFAAYYASINRNEDAENLLKQAIKDNPKNTDIKLALVEFIAKTRKPDDAVVLLEQYSKAEPDDYKLRSMLARLYLAMNNADKAIATYQYTIDKDVHGEGIDARNRVIEILLAQNKRPEAEALIKDILKLEPENGDALTMRARLALADNNADVAIADLRAVVKNTPDASQALFLMAVAQERTGATNLALDTYKKILEKNGNDLPALLGAAKLDLATNQLDEAQKLLERAQKKAGGNLEVTRLLVELYVRKQQWQPALELCDQLTINSNTAALGFYMKGLVLLQKKDIAPAIETLKKSLDKEPRAIEPLQTLISAYLANKQVATAVSYLETHLKTYPDQIHAQELLGSLYGRAGKLSQAEALLTEVIGKQPGRLSTYRELMAVYSAQKKFDQIAALLDSGLQKNPSNSDLLLLQADFLQTNGQDKKALETYERILALQPKSPIVKNNMAVLLIDKFPSDENLRRAQDLTADFADSRNPVLIDTLAWLHYKMKNYPQAISLLESVLVKNIEAPELRYHLGMAYLKNGSPEKAKTELTRATSTQAQYLGRAEAEAELRKL